MRQLLERLDEGMTFTRLDALPPTGDGRMYAVAFDLDTDVLRERYPGANANQAYQDIRVRLVAAGFKWQQGSVYFGGDAMDAVKCVVAVQKLARELPWFQYAVRDIRMLRIEENNDLLPAIVDMRLPGM